MTAIGRDTEAERIKLRNEQHVAQRVIAVLVEQVAGLDQTLGISDETLLASPDLLAYRDDVNGGVILKVSR